MLSKRERLEIVIPVFNEAECLDELMRRLFALKVSLAEVEIGFAFVNDGSTDATMSKLADYASRYPFIKVLDFSRNFGHQIAVTAGLDHVDADYVAIIDADLQDPPELIEEMYRKAKTGIDIVYGKRMTRKGETWFKKLTAGIFYRFISRMCDVDIPEDTGDFRLISRRVLNAVKSMREKHRFLRGMMPWVGFTSEPLLYHRDERHAGETKYPLNKMVKFALDAIFSFSNTPIRVATYTGVFIVCFGVVGGMVLLYLRLFTEYSVPGITAAILMMILLGGIQIIMLGIIGEYIGRIFEESKNRPLYLIKSSINTTGS
jgi:glycosyltransferase involved in cell wall biosynthesis